MKNVLWTTNSNDEANRTFLLVDRAHNHEVKRMCNIQTFHCSYFQVISQVVRAVHSAFQEGDISQNDVTGGE